MKRQYCTLKLGSHSRKEERRAKKSPQDLSNVTEEFQKQLNKKKKEF